MSGCDQSDQALKNFRRDPVHGPVESGVVGSSRNVELEEQLFVTVEVGTELAIGHSRVDHQYQYDSLEEEGCYKCS